MPQPSYLPWSDHPNNIWWTVAAYTITNVLTIFGSVPLMFVAESGNTSFISCPTAADVLQYSVSVQWPHVLRSCHVQTGGQRPQLARRPSLHSRCRTSWSITRFGLDSATPARHARLQWGACRTTTRTTTGTTSAISEYQRSHCLSQLVLISNFKKS